LISGLTGASFQVVGDLPLRPRLRAIDEHLHLALLGPNHHRLLAQPAHHVERTARLPPQRQLQHVVLDAALDDLPQLLGDGKEAIGGAQPLQGLMGPPVVVVRHPQPDPLASRLEAVELRAHQELLPDGFPEAFDLAQGHGMVRAALEVVHPLLPQLRLEPGGPAPARVLAALIGEHLLGHAVLRHRPAEHLQHVLRRLAAEHVQPHHVAGVIVEKADEVGVLAAQPEGEDVGLPQLVGRGALEAARPGRVPRGFGARWLEELVRVQRATHRLPAHGQKQHAPQELADLLDPQVGMAPLEVDDFRLHRRGHLRPRTVRPGRHRLQAGFPLGAVRPHPLGQGAEAHAHFAGDPLHGEAFLQTQLHRFAPDLERVAVSVRMT
jgi:hypothetical protein